MRCRLSGPRGDVELDHVTFGYDPNAPVLRDVSVKIPAGTRAAIVGATGAGKTTIISLLTRFYDVNGGRILLDGHDLREYRRADLRRAFGVVLQDTALFEMSVMDNIRYGHADAPRESVEAAARAAGADSFIRRLPNGYDTVLGTGWRHAQPGRAAAYNDSARHTGRRADTDTGRGYKFGRYADRTEDTQGDAQHDAWAHVVYHSHRLSTYATRT